MAEAPLTVNNLLELPNREFSDKVVAAGVADSGQPDSMKDRVLKGLRGLQWKAVASEIGRKTGEVLEVDVLGVIVAAWMHHKVLDHLEDGKSKGVTTVLPLKEHTIYSQFEPYIEIKLGDFVKKILFDVKLEMTLSGLILRIEDSIIKGVEVGILNGKGDIRVANLPILKRGFGPVELPGRLNLGKGIPIGRST